MPFKLSNNTDLLTGIAGQLEVADVRPDLTMADVLQHAVPGDVIAVGFQSLPVSVVPLASAVALVAAVAGGLRSLRPALFHRSSPA
jgi:hypothetical protein